jgi:integrase
VAPAVLVTPRGLAGTWIRGPDVMKPTRASRNEVLENASAQIAKAIEASSVLSVQTRSRFIATSDRFCLFCSRGCGLGSLHEVTSEIARAFVAAPLEDREPSIATMHLRRSVLRFVFRQARELRLADRDPCVDLSLPPRSGLSARPLTDDEIALCRSYSLTSLTNTRTPAAWALAEATARTAEIPNIRVSDVDLANRRVWLHGSKRTVERWAPLTSWGVVQLARRVAKLDDGNASLVYTANGSAASGQASSCIALSDTLVRAGLAGEPDLRPVSVAAWAGRSLLDQTGRIDAVARLLGVRSLDRAARIVAWDWSQAEDG